MGLDQAVGAQPADEESGDQDPERPAAPRLVERAERRQQKGRKRGVLPGRRLDLRGSVGREADVRGTVAQGQQGDHAGDGQHGGDESERDAPAVVFGQLRQQRQENELSGRVARGQHPDDQAPALGKPARRDRRAKHKRRQSGAEADEDAPHRDKLPDLVIASEDSIPPPINAAAQQTTVRTPKRLMNAAAKDRSDRRARGARRARRIRSPRSNRIPSPAA